MRGHDQRTASLSGVVALEPDHAQRAWWPVSESVITIVVVTVAFLTAGLR